MGAVYLAEHPLIGKKVALKVIHRELASNREVVQRFFQEAKAVNKIGSEHIVEIFDFGATPEGDHFYIMEFLEGRNLASVLGAEAVLDVRRALHIGAQIASALAAAHAAGVIHRDLKPDNVMLTTRLGDQDYVKLLDFGLAKMFAAGSVSAVKTAAGVLLGTPQYMSPEACESRVTIDHRTDIYALGVLLFQMMTGALPFDGETMGEVLVKQVTQLPPPPRQYNPNIPPSVEQILLRCLMKQPDARFPTMTQLREALLDPENYLHRSPPMAPARSLAPGELKVDAKTVMAYAVQEQKTRLGLSNELPLISPPSLPGNAANATMIGDGSLVPPRMTAGPNMSVPAQLKTNTMRIATPLGYSSQQPKRVWPIVLVIALILGLGGGGFAVAWFGRKNPEVASTGAGGGAGTGSGSGSGSVARGSASVAAKGSASATGSATGSASVSATGSASVSATGSASGSATGTGSGSAIVMTTSHVDAGVAVIKPDAAPAVATVSINIDSVPSGADIVDAGGAVLGKTPVTLTLPIDTKPFMIQLRLAGYKKRTKQLVINENMVIQVPLERVPVIIRHPGNGSGSGKQCDTCLERPD